MRGNPRPNEMGITLRQLFRCQTFFYVKTPQFRLLIAAGRTRQTTEHSSLVFLLLLPCKKKIPSDLALERKELTLAYFSYSILCRRFAPRCAAVRASHSDLLLIISFENGILFFKWEKNALVIEEFFWNSRLKAKNSEFTRTIYSNW